MPRWTWAAQRSHTGAEWIGQPPHEELQRKRRPLLPADDSFYTPPPGFEHSRPGTVLRARDVELAFLGLVPQQFTATQLLYRTTDLNGLPQATVTTVVVPTERTSEGPLPDPVLPVRHRRGDGPLLPVVRAAPRRQGDRRAGAVRVSADRRRAGRGLGGVGARPRGPQTESGARRIEPGYHVLDGLRAALNYQRLGLSPDAPIGLWGYSGGGLASAWAAEMHGDYAPELNIVGAVLGSPVGDLGHTFRRLNGSFYSGLPAMVVAALAHVYPELDRVIQPSTPPTRARRCCSGSRG